MKYYKLDGTTQAFFTEGAVEITTPVRADGTLLPNHSGLVELTKDTDGNYYKFYNVDGTPDTVRNTEEATKATIAHFKGLYLGLVDIKLKELDYDSLATVKLWEGDATFGAEATRILGWYKGLIAKNYELLNTGTPLTDVEYLIELNTVIF